MRFLFTSFKQVTDDKIKQLNDIDVDSSSYYFLDESSDSYSSSDSDESDNSIDLIKELC